MLNTNLYNQNLSVNFTNLCVCYNVRSVTFEGHYIFRAFSLHIVTNLSYPVSDLTKNICIRMKSRPFTCSSCLVLDHTLFKRLIIFFAKILFSADRHQITYLLLNRREWRHYAHNKSVALQKNICWSGYEGIMHTINE